MNAFKARNNRISNQNLSETAQNLTRFFEKNTLTQSVKAVPGYTRKKGRNWENIAVTHLIIQTISRHVVRAWENESAMSFGRSGARDRSHS